MILEQSSAVPGSSGGDDVHASKKVLPWTRSKQLERDLEHVNREIYSRNLALAETNKTLALLQSIDALVLGGNEDLEPLCASLSKLIVEATDCPLVAILGRTPHAKEGLEMYGWASSGKVPPVKRLLVDRFRLDSDVSWLKNTDSLKVIEVNPATDDGIAAMCHVDQTLVTELRQALGLESVCFIKLTTRQRLVGVMAVGFSHEKADGLTLAEHSLFMRLSEAVGIAVDHKMLLDENKRVLGQLERTNRKLRMLDRTKDDFISMASHQLRTPLTSVKGYVSMVLDGDVGTITDTQRKLLTQSFVSAQRMVYLISDLLNVSRLRTGKFIIEPGPCNLAEVISEEIEQLTESAKGRNLTLEFNKPETFPTYMLDETKLRQVLMNFMDNAIYYTPSGGHITVNLTETPKSIEFTVTDDGIGVPKAEQHHLFSKFYRAHNAQRARPDGTGLGLFMAKKVIIAQGGATLFRSQEGRGSTFGFTFAKSRLQPVPEAPGSPQAAKTNLTAAATSHTST